MEFSRRRLPHLYCVGQPLFVTFRLHDSLPVGREFSRDSLSSGEAFVLMDRLLDNARYGPVYLKRPEIAGLVRGSIQHCARTNEMHAWVIMANHVHMLLTPHSEGSQLLRRLKGHRARQANEMLGHTGLPFWQDESYDHLMRSAVEFRRIGHYIINNPVKAGLATSPSEYRWPCAAVGGSGDPPQAWTPAPQH